MKESKRKYFSGNTLEQAVTAAACEYGLKPEEVVYRRIEKRHGFLRSRKRFLIAVDPDTPREVHEQPQVSAPPVSPPAVTVSSPAVEERHQQTSPVEPSSALLEDAALGSEEKTETARETSSPVDGTKERQQQDREEVSAAAESMERLLALGALDLKAETRWCEDHIEVQLEGPDAELLLKHQGKSLLALEHLLPKLVRNLTGRKVYCRVDCQNFKQQRKDELIDLAMKAAQTVRDSGEPKTLRGLNPAERRIVHMALADAEDVETESEGRGYLKRLTVWPL